MIRVIDTVSARMRRLATSDPAPAIGKVLQAGAQAIVEDAQHSILDGAVSGARHVPSAPDTPPNADTHHLDESIHVGEVIETPEQVQTSVIVDAAYGQALERGTSRMAERPFLGPATRRHHAEIVRAVAAEKHRHEAG